MNSEDNVVDRRTPLAILICVIIFVAWQKFYLEPRTVKPAPQPAVTSGQTTGTPTATGNTAPPGSPIATALPAGAASRELISKSLVSGTGEVFVSNGPYLLSGWNLK